MITLMMLFLACGAKTDTTKVEAKNPAVVNVTETETVTGTGADTVIVTGETLVTEVSAIINSTTTNTENQTGLQETKTSITDETVSDN